MTTPVPPSIVPVQARRKPRRRLPIAGMAGAVVVGFWLLMAVLGPWLAPDDVGSMNGDAVFAPMSAQYPLGADFLGRDMLSRILQGAPYTVGVALAAVLVASLGGTALALFAAARGGWFDSVVSRLVDIQLSIPTKLLALIMVAAFGSSVPVLVLTIGFGYLPGAFRIARSLAVNVQAMEYVQAARARGEGLAYITFHEMLPALSVHRPAAERPELPGTGRAAAGRRLGFAGAGKHHRPERRIAGRDRAGHRDRHPDHRREHGHRRLCRPQAPGSVT
jgi:peptide/nickel transport system permease protein